MEKTREYLEQLVEITKQDTPDMEEFQATWRMLHQHVLDQRYVSIDEKKKKRMIPLEERCVAKRANGGRCTRRRKFGKFCGTHSNSNTNNIVDDKETGDMKDIVISNVEIQGITYLADQQQYLYMPNDILKSSPHPRIIGRYAIDEFGKPYIMD